nr:hypothetical protein CFP56_33086 [Quercus suber]
MHQASTAAYDQQNSAFAALTVKKVLRVDRGFLQLTFGEGGFEASTSEASVLLRSKSPISKLGITNSSVSVAYEGRGLMSAQLEIP